MAGIIALQCSPDPANGPGQAPCPPGQLISTVEIPTPTPPWTAEDMATFAGIISAPLIVIFAVGIVFGWISREVMK